MSDMLDKMRELLEEEGVVLDDPRPPMEQGLIKALDALREIIIYAEFGRPEGVKREATEALEFIESLHIKFTDRDTNIPPVDNEEREMNISVITDD